MYTSSLAKTRNLSAPNAASRAEDAMTRAEMIAAGIIVPAETVDRRGEWVASRWPAGVFTLEPKVRP